MVEADVRLRRVLRGAGARVTAMALLLGLMVSAGSAQAQDEGGALSLSADGPGVACQADACVVNPGSEFTLTVEVAEAPGAGYIGIQTQVQYNELEYSATADEEDEIVVTEDGFPGIAVRSIKDEENTVVHGMTAGTPPSFVASDYTGPIVVLAFTCTDDYSRNDVELAAYVPVDNPLGSGFKLPQEAGATNVPASDSLLIYCGEPPPGAEETAAAGGPQATAVAATAAAGATPAGPTQTAIAQATATAVARATATAAAETENGTDDDDGGSNTGLWIALAALAAVAALAGAGGYVWMQRRQ
ncbi:MAG: hypothetical protein WEB04_01685 [Dehalococcoidia bacterium]